MSTTFADLVRALRALSRGGAVRVVAIDGEGAAGKTTLACRLAATTGAVVVHTDDFFREMPEQRRRSMSPERGVAPYYDLERLYEQALQPLRSGRAARFDFADGYLPSVSKGVRVVEPADLVLLEGVCSASPEIGDAVDMAVYVDTAEVERRQRILSRHMTEAWDARWLAAERTYFTETRPKSSFDLVVSGATGNSSRPVVHG